MILAAGLSSRFGRPKQLEPVGPGGHALLDYVLHDASLAGFERFVIVIQEALRADFERHLAPAALAGVDVLLVHQSLVLPRLVEQLPPGRTKPWGTGFAVLAAARHVDSPFGVCNADDFYGRGAYAVLCRALREMKPKELRTTEIAASARSSLAVPAVTATYPLAATLSPRGGVSRGICQVDPGGRLAALDEGLNLRLKGDQVVGRTAAGAPMRVPPETPACMSLWGFAPEVCACLAERFVDFVASNPDPGAEFYTTVAVNDLIAAGRVRCRAVPATGQWRGMTFPGDRAEVAAALRAMIESGTYPRRLWPIPKGRFPCS